MTWEFTSITNSGYPKLFEVSLQNTEDRFKSSLTISKGSIGADQNMLPQMSLDQFGHQSVERSPRRGDSLQDYRIILVAASLQKLFNTRKLTLDSPDPIDQILLVMNCVHWQILLVGSLAVKYPSRLFMSRKTIKKQECSILEKVLTSVFKHLPGASKRHHVPIFFVSPYPFDEGSSASRLESFSLLSKSGLIPPPATIVPTIVQKTAP